MPRARVRLTFLVENRAIRGGLAAEHGLAVLVERGGRRVLFDAGASDAVVRNAAALGQDLSRLEAIALSHGHYDHTGGLDALMAVVPEGVSIRAHPSALIRKYAVRPGAEPREIGFRGGDAARRRVVLSEGPVELAPGLLLTGSVPRVSGFEDTGGPFYLDPGGLEPDYLPDDQALIVSTGAGNVLLCGCAHAGVVNTMKRAAELTGGGRFAAVVGGLHLKPASAERVARTVRALGEMGAERVGPAHCTGETASAELARAFGDRFLHCAAGTVLEF
jgi:7,8-dihydropterin-6-yl-methyl-4-(beta-D-ribofuranosyl)aminobenzene 5'-phosphate synthase